MPFDNTPVEAPNKTKEILQEALALIEKGWCQGAFAKDKYGYSCPEDSCYAVSYCIIGAISKVSLLKRFINNDGTPIIAYIIKEDILVWNDAPGRTKGEVIAVFKRAIELA